MRTGRRRLGLVPEQLISLEGDPGGEDHQR
jgi:hypothetical protein